MSPIILAVNYRSRDTMEGRAGRQRILVLVYRSRDTIEGEIKALAGRENVWMATWERCLRVEVYAYWFSFLFVKQVQRVVI